MTDQNIKVKIDLDVNEFNKNAKAMSDALSKVLGKDVDIFNEKIKQTSNNIDNASNSMNKAANAASKTSGTIKQSNQQWTSLALVIQDLPFGFRGIQNNLPALAGSMAGIAGPAYLAFSALVAAITAYDMGLLGATKTTDSFAKSLKEANDEIKDSINYSNSEISTLQSLISIGTNLNNSEDIRKKALIEIKDILSQVNKEEAAKITNMGQAILAVNLYTEALKAQQLQESSGKRIAELQMDLIEKRFLLEKKKRVSEREFNLIQAYLGYPDLQNLESDVLNAEALIRQLEALNEGAVKANLYNPFSKFNKPPKELAKKDVDTSYLERLKEEQKTYKDNLGMFYHYGGLIIEEEDRIAKERAKIAGTLGTQLANIEATTEAKMLSNKQEFGRVLMSQAEKNTKDLEDEEKKKLKAFIESYNTQLDTFDEFYKNRQNLETNDRLGKKALYEQEASDLQYMLDNNFISYDDYLKRISTVFKNWTNNNTAITKESLNNIMNLGRGIMSALGPSLDLLLDKGASIGEVLQKAFSDIAKQLLKVIISAAIAVALLAAMGIVDVKNIGKVFGMLFSQGMGLGSLGFAAPTAAASSTPTSMSSVDVTASGQGMSFILKGQDLLLSVNRAQKASTLKGQNISLG